MLSKTLFSCAVEAFVLELLLFVYPDGYLTSKLLTIVLFDKTSASTAYVVIYYDIVTIVCKAFQ